MGWQGRCMSGQRVSFLSPRWRWKCSRSCDSWPATALTASRAGHSRMACVTGGLTFDPESETIVSVEWVAVSPGNLTLFSLSLRIHSSFIIGRCLLCIRNP